MKCTLVLQNNSKLKESLQWKIRNGFIWVLLKLKIYLGIKSSIHRERLFDISKLQYSLHMVNGVILL